MELLEIDLILKAELLFHIKEVKKNHIVCFFSESAARRYEDLQLHSYQLLSSEHIEHFTGARDFATLFYVALRTRRHGFRDGST